MRTNWAQFVDDLPSCLVTERVWWSVKAAGIPVTLVTQLTGERLDQLRAQCSTWRGPLAAVVYLPLFNAHGGKLSDHNRQVVQNFTARTDELFRASETNNNGRGCQLRLVLMYELFADPRAASLLYPVNSLRNYARLMADTDLIANIDVDLLPSASISAALADPRVLANYTASCRARGVFVLPAFQLVCGTAMLADSLAATGDKAAIRVALNERLRMFSFHKPMFHGPTLFEKWLGSAEPYPITYALNYEPWYMSWRRETPWYDFRYRGYGNNKIAQVAAMNAAGATWFVSPHGFLVHRPHNSTHMRDEFLRAKLTAKGLMELRGTLYEHVESLWVAAQARMAAGSYAVRLEAGVRGCLEALPWWRVDAQQQQQQQLQKQRQQHQVQAQQQQQQQMTQQQDQLKLLQQEQLQQQQDWQQDQLPDLDPDLEG
ncbi:hypothetical protein PLESTB_000403600 [Pleodorina starrii]|uniref:Uncharacterized protein n=1 Tax=Pleodorina starrii TaxID=330485 RepID=A0A9W6EZD4_9CHLO|nr:hypothetical protein PLESTB_000403600 [Pleodorina starrii]